MIITDIFTGYSGKKRFYRSYRRRLLATVSVSALVVIVCGCGQAQEKEESSEGGEELQVEKSVENSGGTKGGEATSDKPSEKEKTRAKQGDSLEWHKPRFQERREERHEMVAKQIRKRGVEDTGVLDAMKHVPRHLCVPERNRGRAYGDYPVPIGSGQTISQPYIVAYMTQMLDLDPGDKVLEIGTGSGYQAAVLAELTPDVYSVEIIEKLAESAEKRLADLGYKTVEMKQGDGYYGWKEHAPYDGIIVTCAAGHIPSPLVEQLKENGRMVIPVGGPGQTQSLMLMKKDEDGEITGEQLMSVRFVPMTGRVQRGK